MTEVDRVKLVEKRVTALEQWRQEVEKLLTFNEPQSETTISTPVEEDYDIPEREEKPKKEVNPLYDYPPTKEEINVDWNLVEYQTGGLHIKPVKFLGDIWGGINDTLKELGYGWKKDGKNSAWEYGYDDGYVAPEEREPPKANPTITTVTVKTDEIDWRVKDKDGNNVQARSGEKAWASVFAWDRDAKKATDRVKNANESLYAYLVDHKSYNDGSYEYTMRNGFFNREPTQ